MNTTPEKNAKPRQKSLHLDEFPNQVDHIAWERAVLERARVAGLFTSDLLNPKEDLFWQKLRAYEAREISKRRQRYRPSRLERFDELAESRVERGIRHGIVDDAAMKCETKMQRRAERFGIKDQTGADGVLAGGVLDWMTDEQRLKMRRARFEKEPRDDEFYRKEWVSESSGDKGIMDEQRMAERRRRFSGGIESQKRFKMKDADEMNVEMAGKRGQESNEIQNFQGKDRFKRSENDAETTEAMEIENDGKTLQEWEITCESWGTQGPQGSDEIDNIRNKHPFAQNENEAEAKESNEMEKVGHVLQEWERTCESWDAQGRQGSKKIQNTREKRPLARSENRTKAREAIETESDGRLLQEWERTCESWGAPGDGLDGQHVPDAVGVNDVTHVTRGKQMMELTKESLLSIAAHNEDDGKVLQSWEAGGEDW